MEDVRVSVVLFERGTDDALSDFERDVLALWDADIGTVRIAKQLKARHPSATYRRVVEVISKFSGQPDDGRWAAAALASSREMVRAIARTGRGYA
jgi:hypothetical protein